MPQSEDRLREIIAEELAKNRSELSVLIVSTMPAALKAWGQGLGLDVEHPLDQQADFRHIRKLRRIGESAGLKAVAAVITVAVTGVMTVAWNFLWHR